jgi:hypothetical protein
VLGRLWDNVIGLRERQLGRQAIRETGFWYVDIPRTSSSALRVELGRRFGPVYGKENLIEREFSQRQVFPDHIPALKMREILGRVAWDQLYTFTIVRNPWDRILSFYHYLRKRDAIPSDWSFSDYVARLVEADAKTPYFRYYGRRYGAANYVLDENGIVIVDEIIRYEDRAAGLQKVSARLRMETLGTLHLQVARPARHPYGDAYNDKTADLVAGRYAKDVTLFGYDF